MCPLYPLHILGKIFIIQYYLKKKLFFRLSGCAVSILEYCIVASVFIFQYCIVLNISILPVLV